MTKEIKLINDKQKDMNNEMKKNFFGKIKQEGHTRVIQVATAFWEPRQHKL